MRATSPAGAPDLAFLAGRRLVPVYQPILDLDSSTVVGYEALARAVGGAAISVAELFLAAQRAGQLAELDARCQVAALEGAAGGGLRAPFTLFLNVEPPAAGASWSPPPVAEVPGLPVMVEVTERDLTAHPAELLRMVDQVRERGWGIALDDIGAASASLALMPFLRPDVLKLDLRLVQQRTTVDVAEIVGAVNAQAERTGALVLAEGIETPEHVDLAVALGARLGQGYLLGRPAPLPPPDACPPPVPLPTLGPERSRVTAGSPYALVADSPSTRTGSKRLLMAMARSLERSALTLDGTGVLLGTFQHATHFTATTASRYRLLAEHTELTAAFAQELPVQGPGALRTVPLSEQDPVSAEWDVVVIGPHYAAALLAHDLGDGGEDLARRFRYQVTYDRERVLEAGRMLLRRMRSAPDASDGDDAAPADPTGALLHGPAVLAGLESSPVDVLSALDPPLPLLVAAVAAIPQAVSISEADGDHRLVYVNAAFERISGFSAAAVLGRNCRLLQGPDTDPEARRAVRLALAAGRPARVTLLNRRPDGTTWWNELRVAPLRDVEGRVTHILGVQDDVTDRVHTEQRVHRLAYYDVLTDLPNRTQLDSHLEAQLRRAEHSGTALAVVYLDLDDLKQVNDRLGHAQGDALLGAVAARLRAATRAGDLLARRAGDEFVLVLPGRREDVCAVADTVVASLHRALADPIALTGARVHLSASIGVAVYPDDADTVAGLLLAADQRMYDAKQRTRSPARLLPSSPAGG